MNSEWIILLIVLLPVAALSGWLAARFGSGRSSRPRQLKLSPEYYKGLNYVLNEQPDKAIEIFIKMLEVDSETVETHLALGSLFRRRGEVDRAIRIHQNLIARPTLDSDYKSQALLELGLDYMKLGILDRAEGLFTELVASGRYTRQAYTHLLDIYQQEREWDNAIVTAQKLESISATDLRPLMAHFYCELASLELANNNEKTAIKHLKHALSLDPKCVRASMIEAEMARKSGNHQAAIKAYTRIENQDPGFLAEVIVAMRYSYQALNKSGKYREYVAAIHEKYGGIAPLLCLTDLIAEADGENAAIKFLSEQLHKRPTVQGVDRLVKYSIARTEGELNRNLSTIKELTTRLLENRAVYKCETCGFEAKNLHWKCPGCKSWNTVKPVKGIQGE
jgi:lipopolysaccharide biosynthesis regulator YciM